MESQFGDILAQRNKKPAGRSPRITCVIVVATTEETLNKVMVIATGINYNLSEIILKTEAQRSLAYLNRSQADIYCVDVESFFPVLFSILISTINRTWAGGRLLWPN